MAPRSLSGHAMLVSLATGACAGLAISLAHFLGRMDGEKLAESAHLPADDAEFATLEVDPDTGADD